jgi:hypothetical protein
MRERYVKTVEDEERMQHALRAVEKKQLPHMLCVTNMLLHGIHDPSFSQVRKEIETFCATTVGNWGISVSNLKLVRVPVLPLPEQHRIVAKTS